MRSVEPLTVETAGTDRRVNFLPSRMTYNIGSYLGVPVKLAEGRLYGTICVLDPEPHRFSGQDLDLLITLAGWLRLYLERDQLSEPDGMDAR